MVLITISSLGIAGLAFLWLLFQTVNTGRVGWRSAVIAPAMLFGYSGWMMATSAAPVLSSGWSRYFGLLLAMVAGFLFDRGSSLRGSAKDLQGQRSPLPLLLWGLGMFAYCAAPLSSYLDGWRPLADRWSGAMLAVSSCSLGGQALNWVRRIRAAKVPHAVSTPHQSFVSAGVAALVAFWLLLPSGPASVAGGRGSTAPPNSLLVSTAGALSNGPIFIFDRASGTSRKLAPEGARARWSPDGARMAFTRTEPVELWAASEDGSNAQRLTGMSGAIFHATWSADCQRIYFGHGEGFLAGRLMVVAATGGSPEEVLPVSEGVDFPEVSPDGRSLAYFRGADSTAQVQPPKELKLLDLAARQTRSLASDPSGNWNVTGLAWTRDGRALIVCSSDISNRQFQLERVEIENPQRRPLGNSLDYYLSSFTAAADGSGILMLAMPYKGGNPDPSRAAEIWLVDPDSGSHQSIPFDNSVKPQTLSASPTR